jgi:hypothetical protein
MKEKSVSPAANYSVNLVRMIEDSIPGIRDTAARRVGTSALAKRIRIGDSEAKVRLTLGEPSGMAGTDEVQSLLYREGWIDMKSGIVVGVHAWLPPSSDSEAAQRKTEMEERLADERQAVQQKQEEKDRTAWEDVFAGKSRWGNWPAYSKQIPGSVGHKVRVLNPNTFAVKVGLRKGSDGEDFIIGPNGEKTTTVPPDDYEMYFLCSHDPGKLHKGGKFSVPPARKVTTVTIPNVPFPAK